MVILTYFFFFFDWLVKSKTNYFLTWSTTECLNWTGSIFRSMFGVSYFWISMNVFFTPTFRDFKQHFFITKEICRLCRIYLEKIRKNEINKTIINVKLKTCTGHNTKMSHWRAITLWQLSVTMTSWVRIWLALIDSWGFIAFVDINQILLKMYFILIISNAMYLSSSTLSEY